MKKNPIRLVRTKLYMVYVEYLPTSTKANHGRDIKSVDLFIYIV